MLSPGDISSLQHMCGTVKVPVYGVQCTQDVPETSIHDMAQYYIQVNYIYDSICHFWKLSVKILMFTLCGMQVIGKPCHSLILVSVNFSTFIKSARRIATRCND